MCVPTFQKEKGSQSNSDQLEFHLVAILCKCMKKDLGLQAKKILKRKRVVGRKLEEEDQFDRARAKC